MRNGYPEGKIKKEDRSYYSFKSHPFDDHRMVGILRKNIQ